jgi:trimethylamine:corrinoid methyltransferase-like protein
MISNNCSIVRPSGYLSTKSGKHGMTEQDIALKIHQTAVDLMQDPGINPDHDEICDLLLSAGAETGNSDDVIRFPKELIAEKIGLCPKLFVFADRSGQGPKISVEREPVI